MTTVPNTAATSIEPAAEYQPGVCNIGAAEARNRRGFGWGGLLASLVVAALLLVFDAPIWSGAVLFLPGFVMGTGFIQAKARFCSGYGMAGMSQFGELGSQAATTADAEARAADRARAKRITVQSALVGLVAALVVGALLAIV